MPKAEHKALTLGQFSIILFIEALHLACGLTLTCLGSLECSGHLFELLLQVVLGEKEFFLVLYELVNLDFSLLFVAF